MPYRNQATVEAWVREYLAGHPAAESSISVLEKDYTPGPDSGLVVVALSNASTVTYIQPVVHDEGPRWVVTFEARADSFDLDAAGVARLSSDLAAVAELCGFLQERTEKAIAETAGRPARSHQRCREHRGREGAQRHHPADRGGGLPQRLRAGRRLG